MAREFGSLSFWNHVPGVPRTGSPAERAAELLKIWREKRVGDLCPRSPNKGQDIFRALALELVFADDCKSDAVYQLLIETLPKWAYALYDPIQVYSGEHAGPGAARQMAWRRIENLCMGYDRDEIARVSDLLPLDSLVERIMMDVTEDEHLRRGVAHLWGDGRDAPAISKTIAKWRKKPHYKSDLESARFMREMRQRT